MSKKNRGKIAFLISAYTEPESLLNLVKRLQFDYFDIFIHIDKKVDISLFENKISAYKNVIFLPDELRVKIYWGGYSQVKMQYNMIYFALSRGNYNRIVNITGTDYPTVENSSLYDMLTEDTSKEYIIGFDCKKEVITPESNKKRLNMDKFTYFFHMETNKVIWRLEEKFIRVKKKIDTQKLNMDFFYGSEYWALTQKCLEDLMKKFDEAVYFKKILKTSFAPSEAWIHTLFFNSKYGGHGKVYPSNIDKGLAELSPLTYFVYDPDVHILTEEYYEEIIKSGKPFCRKVIVGKSDELIRKLKERTNSGNL